MKNAPMKVLIKSSYRDLSKKERAIADFILKNPKKVSRMTLNEIAQELDIATSTVFQFTRKLGYSGFRDFRNDILAEEFDPTISIHENVSSTDSSLGVAQKVFASSIKSLKETSNLLVEDTLDQAIELLIHADVVTFFGLGGSNVVAFDAYHKFLRSPLHCQYGTDFHIQLMQAALLSPDSCAVITTHTGLTKEALEVAHTVRNTGAHIIALTSYPSQQLKELADVVLVSVSDETGYRSESLSSRISQLALIDSLFTSVMFRMQGNAEDSLRKIRHVIASTKEENE